MQHNTFSVVKLQENGKISQASALPAFPCSTFPFTQSFDAWSMARTRTHQMPSWFYSFIYYFFKHSGRSQFQLSSHGFCFFFFFFFPKAVLRVGDKPSGLFVLGITMKGMANDNEFMALQKRRQREKRGFTGWKSLLGC